jgi:hypothetical protein
MGADITLGQDFDLVFDQGDLLISNDLEQRTMLILASHKGHFKQWPLIGGGLSSALNSPFGAEERRQISLALNADLIRVKSIFYDQKNLTIDANSSI